MRKRIPVCLSFTMLAMLSPAANAAPILTLSSPTDLTTLTIGQNVTINVTLSGLAQGNLIYQMFSQVLFSPSVFTPVLNPGFTSGLTPGGILKTGTDVANFDSASSFNASNAAGNYSDSSPNVGTAISSNGLFYSFTLHAAATGSGGLSFSPTATYYAGTDTGFAFAPLPLLGPLAYNVSTVPTPEPSTFGFFVGLGLIAALTGTRLRTPANQVFMVK